MSCVRCRLCATIWDPQRGDVSSIEHSVIEESSNALTTRLRFALTRSVTCTGSCSSMLSIHSLFCSRLALRTYSHQLTESLHINKKLGNKQRQLTSLDERKCARDQSSNICLCLPFPDALLWPPPFCSVDSLVHSRWTPVHLWYRSVHQDHAGYSQRWILRLAVCLLNLCILAARASILRVAGCVVNLCFPATARILRLAVCLVNLGIPAGARWSPCELLHQQHEGMSKFEP